MMRGLKDPDELVYQHERVDVPVEASPMMRGLKADRWAEHLVAHDGAFEEIPNDEGTEGR
jgi:hypothetical protein